MFGSQVSRLENITVDYPLFTDIMLELLQTILCFPCSLGMFEFLDALQKQLTAVCKGFTEWLEQLTPDATVTTSASVQSSYSNQVNKLIKMVLLAVQRVMNRHKDDCYTLNTSEGGETKVNAILHSYPI